MSEVYNHWDSQEEASEVSQLKVLLLNDSVLNPMPEEHNPQTQSSYKVVLLFILPCASAWLRTWSGCTLGLQGSWTVESLGAICGRNSVGLILAKFISEPGTGTKKVQVQMVLEIIPSHTPLDWKS